MRIFSSAELRRLTVLTVGACCFTVSACAQDESGGEARFSVPDDATTPELIKLIDEFREVRPQTVDEMTELQAALEKVASRVLEDETASEKNARTAAEAKFIALTWKRRLGNAEAEADAKALAEKLQQDSRPGLVEFGKLQLVILRIQSVAKLTAEEQKSFVNELFQPLADDTATGEDVGLAIALAEMLEQDGKEGVAASAYERLAELAPKSSVPGMAESANVFAGTARRLKLPGNRLVLNGETVDGEAFRWDDYRGKVVLVDFWATWCSVCLDELPNVRAHYEAYKDQGFDVVGVNVDDNKFALMRFLSQQEPPWTNLWKEDHPNAERYGITALPTVLLVDKDGKVVSMNARGPELTRLLKELLGPPKTKN